MSKLLEKLDKKKSKDIRILADFVSIFCREKHPEEAKAIFPINDERLQLALGNHILTLCPDCAKLLKHAIAKRSMCPHDPKPMCKKCKTHCYAPAYREKIRQVMRFSGLYMVRHGRLDLMIHYLF